MNASKVKGLRTEQNITRDHKGNNKLSEKEKNPGSGTKCPKQDLTTVIPKKIRGGTASTRQEEETSAQKERQQPRV